MIGYYTKEWERLAPSIVDRWCPSFTGNTGLQLPSTTGKTHGVLTNFANNGNDAYVTSQEQIALNTDGTNDYVIAGIREPVTSQYTISIWLWRNGIVNFRNAFNKGSGNSDDIEVYISSNTNSLIVFHNRGNGGSAAAVAIPVFPNQTWTHVFITYDVLRPATFTKDGRWQVWYNGIQQSTGSASVGAHSAPLNTQSKIQIGGSENTAFGSTRFWLGQLDDLILSNTAFTGADAQFIYEQGRGGGLLYEPPRRKTYFVPSVGPNRQRSSRLLCFPG
jgi:hypothetical protein